MLRQAIQGISDLILVPGLINLDFADVKTIMSGMGFAIMGTGLAEGEDRAMDAANLAISSPLLEDASVSGARGVIINVTGGPDLSLVEVSEASAIIQEAAHEDANIIFGAVVDPKMAGKVKITVIATGFERPSLSPQVKPAAPAATNTPTPVDLQLLRLVEAGVRRAAAAQPAARGCRCRGARCSRSRRRRQAGANGARGGDAGRRVRAGLAARRAGVPAAPVRRVVTRRRASGAERRSPPGRRRVAALTIRRPGWPAPAPAPSGSRGRAW